jgi:DNA-binding PadR family transcriptional regulator
VYLDHSKYDREDVMGPGFHEHDDEEDWAEPPHPRGPHGFHHQRWSMPVPPPPPEHMPPPIQKLRARFGPGFGRPGPMGPMGPMGRMRVRPGPRVRRGDVRAAVLSLLSDEPRNGYQLIQDIAQRTEGIWRPSPGSVYPALSQLEDEGLVEATADGTRRTFGLTEAGRSYVNDHSEELAEPWAAVAESVSEEMADLHGLFHQLGMAMEQVAAAGTAAQHQRAARILTRARRDLYRLLAEVDGDVEDEE